MGYFYGNRRAWLYAKYSNGSGCFNIDAIVSNGGEVVENSDGVVSLYINGWGGLTEQPITQSCCSTINSNYFFDVNTQNCLWSQPSCDVEQFKVVLNPKGNDGVFFNVEEHETCGLDISFDYLFQFDCKVVMERLNNQLDLTPQELIEYQSSITQYNDCLSQQTAYENELSVLNEELVNTYYTIRKSNLYGGGIYGVNVGDYGDSGGTTNNLDINFGFPPRSLRGYEYSYSYYCLTELGLNEWSKILNTNNYNTWLNSNGSDTTVYTTDDVDTLLTTDNQTNTYITECSQTTNSRSELILRINEVENSLNSLQCELIEPDTVCTTITEMFENLDVYMSLDVINTDTNKLESVYEEQLYNIGQNNLVNYLNTNQPNTGLLTTGETCDIYCENLAKVLMTEIKESAPTMSDGDIQTLVQNSLDSKWLNFNSVITNQDVINNIVDKKIKISLIVKNSCVDFGILIDRINLTKNCSLTTNSIKTITESPSFDMVRVVDNKKSWLSNTDSEHRDFDLKYRETEYDLNNHKLVINSKEVNLDINPANAIEQDMFCYIRDNICLLECPTTSASTGDSCCCQGELITFKEDVTTNVFNEYLLDVLNGCYSPITGYSFTTNWMIDVYINCDELIYSEVFFNGNGSTFDTIVPSQDDYATALEDMSLALNLGYSYDGEYVTLTETNDCENSLLNNGFKIDLNLTVCACYLPYVGVPYELPGICDNLSGNTLTNFVLTSFDFIDDLQYQPSCELLEVYGCYDDQTDYQGQFRADRDANSKSNTEYNNCLIYGYPHEFCIVGNENLLDYDWYYDGLAQSEIAFSGYSVYDIIGPMRTVSMNNWMAISNYEEWTLPMSNLACSNDPIYSGVSLSEVFSGITDITYLPVVGDYSEISGVTGNSGDIIIVTGTSTEYYWNPIDMGWVDIESDCIGSSLGDMITTRREYQNAYLKAKNQFMLSLKPFLWASTYIPEFQVNKYIL